MTVTFPRYPLADVVTPIAHGAVGNGSDNDTVAFKAAVAAAISAGLPLDLGSYTYFLDETIAPGGRFTWFSNGATLYFDADATGYTNALTKAGADSGVDLLVDMEDCSNSRVIGRLIVDTNATVTDMTISSQANIPTTLAAIGARQVGSTNGEGAESQFDEVFFSRVGYGLFQADQSGAGTDNTPFTRWRVSLMTFRFCKNPLWSGDNGNGFNDMWCDVVRFSRCAGQIRIKGTDFNCGSMFFFGFTEGTDDDAATYTSSAGSANITTSLDLSATISSGDTILLGDDGSTNWPDDNLNSDGIHFGSIVSSVATTTVTLQTNVVNAVTAGKLYYNPARLFVGAGALNVRHLYCEGIGATITAQNESVITIGELKIGGSSFGGINGAPIVYGGHQGSIEVTVKGTTVISDQAKAIVVLSLVERDSDSENANRFVRVKSMMTKAEAETYAALIDYQTIPSAFVDGSHTQVTGQTMLDNAVVQAGDGDHWIEPSLSGGVRSVMDYGRYQGTELTIATGAITVTSNMMPTVYKIDTEADAATDDLDTINGGYVGQIVILTPAASTRDPTIKDSTGNLLLAGDFAMLNNNKTITLMKTDATNWRELSRSDN